MIMTILVLVAGIMLSITAAYYSIVGLIAIFPGAVIAIIAMGSTLEIAKLVAASWLYRNWRIAPLPIRMYLSAAVVLLMFITSMGVFGFLSKAHLEHSTVTSADSTYQLQTINDKIESKQKSASLIERQLNNIDSSLEKYLENGSITTGLQQKRRLDGERRELEAERKVVEEELVALKEERNKLSVEVQKQEVEVGPLKYIAELIYGEDAKNHFDSAVRWVIILLIMVFDPLAVILLIAANTSANQNTVDIKPKRKYTRRKPLTTAVVEEENFGIQHVESNPQPGPGTYYQR